MSTAAHPFGGERVRVQAAILRALSIGRVPTYRTVRVCAVAAQVTEERARGILVELEELGRVVQSPSDDNLWRRAK